MIALTLQRTAEKSAQPPTPMETKIPEFSVNSYVLFRNTKAWREGRVVDARLEDKKLVYTVLCLRSFYPVAVQDAGDLAALSNEERLRLQPAAFSRDTDRIVFPVLLKNIMKLDKDWVKTNTYTKPAPVTVSRVLRDFAKFFSTYAPGIAAQEVAEAERGFLRAFETLLPRVLLYKNEQTSHNVFTLPVTEIYGPIYLLRLLYALQKESAAYVPDESVRDILREYVAYLLDFLALNYKAYF
ncbi:mortality factor 4-like protein 1 [Pancytospora philotis]|nr:mortality factor 4-like protein 1 [Pancytospora philotis]